MSGLITMLVRAISKRLNDFGGRRFRRLNCAGFSLVEMLTALLIVSLMTGLVAVGISISTEIYKKEQFASQSQVLFDTIENALSDPLRFAQPDSSNEPVIVYRNNDIDSRFVEPGLKQQAGSKATRQVLYLYGSNNSEGVPLLNEGVYGDCTVSNVAFSIASQDEGTWYRSTVELTIKSTRDDSLSLSRTFTFDSEPGVSKDNLFNAEIVSGDVPVEVEPEREGTDAADHLYGGAGTAEDSGFPEYSSSLVAADKRALGNAITDANNALSELSSQRTAEQIDALRSAISSALAVMINLRSSQDAVDSACDQLNAAIATFRNASSGGGSGEQQEPYTLKLNGAWNGNKNYGITFRNLSSNWVDSVTVELTAHGTVTGIDGNVTAVRQGDSDKWLVTFTNYGNGLAGNATVENVYMHVTGEGDFSLS